MSDRFELSFKNKIVRVWLIIMISAFIVELFMIQFTMIPIFTTIPWIMFFIWLYFYKKRQKRENTIT